CAFPETAGYMGKREVTVTGLPIRDGILSGDRARGLEACSFKEGRPVILVTGGSQGAKAVNEAVRSCLPELLKGYQVCHLCGKGWLDESLEGLEGYWQAEFVSDGLGDLLAMADMAISRAGATTIHELLASRVPMLLIPLPLSSSRGDQIRNAESFAGRGLCAVAGEDMVKEKGLMPFVEGLAGQREAMAAAMAGAVGSEPVGMVVDAIVRAAAGGPRRKPRRR
ncbi:MAG: UDP-N-acetylglucosamine--N-acetylmuramyl-(pentapeptide) pyrophosphoryl-undecaprenol N-acetylglucosamine transferase, partial [Oscillospiraceae bacterium]|nr:UDP-N-acetylglucosamine--N-acetylmuramyl-(pentapeptide) pyrophosphoryl-undecaprenol N-acetylglucosamine transferase [Oscillospiraceae bacterium]